MKKDLVQGITRDLVRSYEAEAKLLNEVTEYTERSEKLATEGNFAALCDCLLGRGERIEAIAQLEVKRAKLEKEFAGLIHGDIEEARGQALIAHGKAILANNRLRTVLADYKDIFEHELAAFEQSKPVARAYNGVSDSNSVSMFLDRER